jgi:hypothetical protein
VKKRNVWLITCFSLAHTPRPYLYNSTLISLQLDLWLIWTLSHNVHLFELLTSSYSDSNSTWFPPHIGFQLNRIPYPWTLPGSDLAYPDLDPFLLELKVLVPFWTWTPSQFRLVSSIIFLNSSEQLTQVTFILSAYLISPNRLTRIPPEQLARTPPERPTRALLNHINAYPALYVQIQPNYLTRFFSRSVFYLPGLNGLTRPNYLTRSLPDRTSAYPIVPSHLTWLPYLAG